jgi:hypothetical protein
MHPYNFDEFLKRMVSLDIAQITVQGHMECRRVTQPPQRLLRSKGAVDERKADRLQYANDIKGFLFYLHRRKRPEGLDDDKFQRYRTVIEALIRKGQLPSKALNDFR